MDDDIVIEGCFHHMDYAALDTLKYIFISSKPLIYSDWYIASETFIALSMAFNQSQNPCT